MHDLEIIFLTGLVFSPVLGIALIQPSPPQKIIVLLLILAQMGISFRLGEKRHQSKIRQQLERIYEQTS